jgi:hypothetical protein
VLFGDGTTRAIRDLRVGDIIYGTVVRGRYRRYARTRVLDHWSSFRRAFRVRLGDGTEIIASGDHRFLSRRGWKHVTNTPGRDRAHLTSNDKLLGTGGFAEPPNPSDPYKRGYMCGMIRGDGHLDRYFRLALVDLEALPRPAIARRLPRFDARGAPICRRSASSVNGHWSLTETGTRAFSQESSTPREALQHPAESFASAIPIRRSSRALSRRFGSLDLIAS